MAAWIVACAFASPAAQPADARTLEPDLPLVSRWPRGGGFGEVAMYPGVHHGYESIAGLAFAERDWNTRDCAGRYRRETDGRLTERASGRAIVGDATRLPLDTCNRLGHRTGGDGRVKAQATEDLLQFLRHVRVLHDAPARAVVPDCSTLVRPSGGRRAAGCHATPC